MKDFKVTVTNRERAAEWEKLLGSATVCVKSPIPRLADLPGKGRSLIYELDLDLLSDEQKENLVVWLAGRFGIPVDDVRADLGRIGVPILATDCIVMIDHPQRWL